MVVDRLVGENETISTDRMSMGGLLACGVTAVWDGASTMLARLFSLVADCLTVLIGKAVFDR